MLGFVGGIIFTGLAIGFFISFAVFIPTFIYIIPYCLWVGSQNTVGRQLDKKKEKYWRSVRNATRLYKSWITRTEPTF